MTPTNLSPSATTSAPHTTGRTSTRSLVAATVGELLRRERRLAIFGFTLLALLLPMALAWGIDERALRGANVWIKPMKFALSLSLFALTTAWFVGHLLPAARRLRSVDVIVWVLIVSASFELAYIALQAWLGQGSHYNVGDPIHAAMYSLMGLGALALTATQPALAWLLWRHADPRLAPAYRLAVVSGLVLTFVLGASVGGVLSALQPPETNTLPFIGWSMAGGDLRPAHFLGIHVQQLLPLVGLAVAGFAVNRGRRIVWVVTACYVLLFLAAFAWGLVGRL